MSEEEENESENLNWLNWRSTGEFYKEGTEVLKVKHWEIFC
jgi:hypothetical protein